MTSGGIGSIPSYYFLVSFGGSAIGGLGAPPRPLLMSRAGTSSSLMPAALIIYMASSMVSVPKDLISYIS